MNEPYLPASGYPPQPGYPPPARRQGLGCFAIGCIVVVVAFVLLVALLGGLGWYGYTNVQPFLGKRQLPVRTYPATQAQYDHVLDNFRIFVTTLSTDHAATLTLTADDLNTWIALAPEAQEARGRVYLAIANNELIVDSSFPLPSSTNGAARQPTYFSGRLTLSASFAGGEFTFVSHQLKTVDGKPAPALVEALVENPGFSSGFNRNFNESFRKQIEQNPTATEFVNKIRTINIQNNRIVITAADR